MTTARRPCDARRLLLLAATVFALAFVVRSAAQTPAPPTFRYECDLLVQRPGPQRAALGESPALLGGGKPFAIERRPAGRGETVAVATSGLDDLRLFDPAGREVPYLLVEPKTGEREWIGGDVLPIAATKRASGFEADFARRVILDQVAVEQLPAPFIKRLRIEASGDRAHWAVVAPDVTLFDLPAEHLRRVAVDIAPGEYRYVRFVCDDTSSARLPTPHVVIGRTGRAAPGPPAVTLSVPVERRTSEPGRNRYAIRLPGAHLPLVALELSIAGGDVLRQARVTESRLSGAQLVPVELGRATLRRTVRDGAAAADLRIPIDQPRDAQIELAIDDGDNPPLPITGATAVFAQLPWIFFEAGEPGRYLAKVGNPKLHAPRYDLEAERSTVVTLQAANANWGSFREAARTEEGPAAALLDTGAALDTSGFACRREIRAGKPGLAALTLDAAVLAHSRSDLSDLRIAGGDGRQVPYLIERLDEPLALDLPALAIDSSRAAREVATRESRSTTVYAVRLPYAKLPRATLVLKTAARIFKRDLRLEYDAPESGDDRRRAAVVVASASWSHADRETPPPPVALQFGPVDVSTLRLVVDEGDNAPLPIARPTLLLPGYRVRFQRRTAAPLELLYGKPRIEAPDYDLALVAPSLLGAVAEPAQVGPEQTMATAAVHGTVLFWSALVATILLLGVMIARLLKKA